MGLKPCLDLYEVFKLRFLEILVKDTFLKYLAS